MLNGGAKTVTLKMTKTGTAILLPYLMRRPAAAPARDTPSRPSAPVRGGGRAPLNARPGSGAQDLRDPEGTPRPGTGPRREGLM